MEALLGIVEANASSSTASSSRTAESSLALLCLADLAAGSETAKVRRCFGRSIVFNSTSTCYVAHRLMVIHTVTGMLK